MSREGVGRSRRGGARPGRGRLPRPGLGNGEGCAQPSPPPSSPSRRPAVRLHSAGAPGPRHRARRRRLRRESEKLGALRPAPGPPPPLTLRLLFRSFPPLPAPSSSPVREGGEDRTRSARAVESGCGGAGGRAPAPRSSPNRGSRRTPRAPTRWRAGRQPAPSRSLSRAMTTPPRPATTNPRSAPVRLPTRHPINTLTLFGPPLEFTAPSRSPPMPCGLEKRPTRLPQSRSAPLPGPPATPARLPRLLLSGPQPVLIL